MTVDKTKFEAPCTRNCQNHVCEHTIPRFWVKIEWGSHKNTKKTKKRRNFEENCEKFDENPISKQERGGLTLSTLD